jgi:hypothetical protein
LGPWGAHPTKPSSTWATGAWTPATRARSGLVLRSLYGFAMSITTDRLAYRIKHEHDPRIRACLTAEMGIHLARSGDFDRARSIAICLRSEFRRAEFISLTCWLCLLDGVILFYERPDADALDRVRRAYHLSRAMKNSDFGVWSTAWLAHLEFNRGDVLESVQLSLEALRSANRNIPGALARIALTAAVICCYSGDWEVAADWFRNSREQALVDGDRLAVSSVLHNIATYHVHALRLSEFCGVLLPCDFEFFETELSSSRNYDEGIGLLSLSVLGPIVYSQSLILKSRFGEALEVINECCSSLEGHGLIRYKSILLADRLLCTVKMQKSVNISNAIDEIMSTLSEVSDSDDRALVYGVLSCILKTVDQACEVDKYRSLCADELSIHEVAVSTVKISIKASGLNADSWPQLYQRQ